MVLQHNIEAWNSDRNLKIVTKRQSKSSEKLSTGYKINRAADDAAGLTISEGMRSMIRGLNRASDNAEDGYSLLQTADGALEEIHSILQRGRELSVQAANDSNTKEDRAALQAEIDELLTEIDRIAETTEFNTMKLLDGSKSGDTAINPLIQQNAAEKVMRQGVELAQPGVALNPVVAAGVSATSGQISAVENALKDMVPRAVGGIINRFSSAFNGQAVSNQIGVQLNQENSSTLAYVACSYSRDSTGKILSMNLNLTVNMNYVKFDPNNSNQIDSASKDRLEATIAHEMMHAFMDDVLPNGMLGATEGVIDKSNQFPQWFKEGMAQTVAGGCSDYNDWVNGNLGLDENTSESSISAVVTSSGNRLSSGTTASQYGTGYLACMYLGYLAGGASAVTSTVIGQGLDKLLSEIRDGKTLNQAISDNTNKKYTSIGDFQRKFGDSDSAQFIHKLLAAVETGGHGSGSVIPELNVMDAIQGAASNNTYYVPDFLTPSGYTPAAFPKPFKDGGSGGYNGNGQALKLQVGSLGHQGIGISIEDAHTDALGLGSISVMSFEEAGSAISDFDYAIDCVSNNRSSIGAYMNRLEHTIANLDNTSENTQAAESGLRDTDMADEMVEYSTANILAQTGQSILAQANQSKQGILQLLQ